MIYNIILSSKAEDDFLQAWSWYEEQQSGLGGRFESALFEKIDLISKDPLHYPKKGKFRVAVIKDFPYLVIYEILKRTQTVSITAVFHTSRHPGKKFK